MALTKRQTWIARRIISAWSPSHFQKAWIVYLHTPTNPSAPRSLRVSARTYTAICAAGVMDDDPQPNQNPREGYAKRAIPIGFASAEEARDFTLLAHRRNLSDRHIAMLTNIRRTG